LEVKVTYIIIKVYNTTMNKRQFGCNIILSFVSSLEIVVSKSEQMGNVQVDERYLQQLD
jgi:hypothetical protein